MGQNWKNCATIGVGKLEYVLVLPVRLCNIFITFFIHKDPNVSTHDTKGQGDSILKMVEILLYFLQHIGSVDLKTLILAIWSNTTSKDLYFFGFEKHYSGAV